jgi:NAD(P)-dependent dehydrogenase (short-subunit alcohol dehydrogenase family)
MNASIERSILVTGASSGIGKASAFALLDAGFHVYAAVRSEAAALQLRDEAPAGSVQRLETLPLDVTNEAQIRAAVEHIAAATGSRGLWGLFNNAGISVAAPLEFVTSDDLRRQLEVNVVGQHAVTRAFIPLLRQARGRILTTGSVAGFIAVPGLGPYAMSKHAMEAFSDALRRELRPWGIHVSLLEPGAIATDIWQKALGEFDERMRAPPPGLVETYGGLLNSAHELAQRSVRHASPATVVAAAAVHAFTAPRPRTRYCMGADSRMQQWISRLPDRWADALLAKVLRWG